MQVVSGVATFSSLSIAKTAAGYTLAASSSPVLTPAPSSAFNVTLPSGNYLYVANLASDSVSVVKTNGATNTVVDSISTGTGSGPFGVAVSSDGQTAYVSRFYGNKVSVYQTLTGSIIDSVATYPSGNPTGVSIGPDGDTVFVTNNGPAARRLSAFSTSSPRVDVDIDIGLTTPVDLVARHDFVWIATETGRVERYYRTAQGLKPAGTVDTVVTVGTGTTFLEGIAATPNGQFMYVTINDSGTVMVLDTSNVTATSTRITVGNKPDGIAITPAGFAYVANTADGTVSVINTATTLVTTTITVGSNPHGVAVSRDGQYVFVTNSAYPSPGSVSVIATATNSVVATVSAGIGINPRLMGAFTVP